VDAYIGLGSSRLKKDFSGKQKTHLVNGFKQDVMKSMRAENICQRQKWQAVFTNIVKLPDFLFYERSKTHFF